jgi:hypothetical protein
LQNLLWAHRAARLRAPRTGARLRRGSCTPAPRPNPPGGRGDTPRARTTIDLDEARLAELENRLHEVVARLQEAFEHASHADQLRAQIERQIARVHEMLAEIRSQLERCRSET